MAKKFARSRSGMASSSASSSTRRLNPSQLSSRSRNRSVGRIHRLPRSSRSRRQDCLSQDRCRRCRHRIPSIDHCTRALPNGEQTGRAIVDVDRVAARSHSGRRGKCGKIVGFDVESGGVDALRGETRKARGHEHPAEAFPLPIRVDADRVELTDPIVAIRGRPSSSRTRSACRPIPEHQKIVRGEPGSAMRSSDPAGSLSPCSG